MSDPQKPASGDPGADKEPARGAFWKKLATQAGVIGGALLAIGGALKVVPDIIRSTGEAGRAVGNLFTTEKPATSFPIIEVKALPTLPHSLLNVMKTESHDFLHLLHLDVKNQSSELLHLVVEVEVVSGGFAMTESPRAGMYTLKAGEVRSYRVDPLIRFMQRDFPTEESLKLVWRVSTERQNLLSSGTERIVVLPNNVLDWDLRGPDGKPVPPDFLLASVSAWMLTPNPLIVARAREHLGAEPDPQLRFRTWLQRCHESLFGPSGPVRVSADARAFPLKGRQVIRTPAQVLQEGQATALEASLLLASLRREIGPEIRGRMALLALPTGGQATDEKVLLIAWSTDGTEWRGLDMNQAGRLGFQENESQATPRAVEALHSRPDILKDLDERGVFFKAESAVLALDFGRAAEHYRIRPPP